MALSFFIALVLHADATKIDSLIQLIDRAGDTTRMGLLTELCWELTYVNPQQALQYGQEALTLAEASQNKIGLAGANNRLGIVYDVIGKYDKALEHYNKSLQYSYEINNKKSIASVLNNIGLIYWNLGDYKRALENYFQALRVFEVVGDDKGIANSLNNIGLIYWDNEQFDEALRYQQEALNMRQKMGDKYGVGASLTNMALIYHDQQNYQWALDLFYKSMAYKEEINDNYGLGISYKGLATTYEKMGNIQEAFKWYEKALRKKWQVNDQYGIASLHLNISAIYMRVADYQRALHHLEKAKKIAEQLKSNKLLYKVYLSMAQCYADKKNYAMAYEYHKKYAAAYDSMFNEQKSKQIAELQILHETEKKEKEIALLNRENDIANLELRRRTLLLGWVITVFVIILLLMLVVYSRYKIRQQKLLQQEREKQQQLLLKTIIETQEQERNRISRELHDNVGQMLAAAKFNFTSLADQINIPESASRKLEHIAELLSDAITELSSISQQIMPKILREEGLIPAIDHLLDKTLRKTHVTCRFQHFGQIERLSETIEIHLYRIVQELISNIIKHSGATEVNVQLSRAKNHLVLTIEDNGKGMNETIQKNGMGLANITSRAEAMNGKFHYESSPGMGTTSIIRIPL